MYYKSFKCSAFTKQQFINHKYNNYNQLKFLFIAALQCLSKESTKANLTIYTLKQKTLAKTYGLILKTDHSLLESKFIITCT